ncbi:hypothetical protein [Streptomyces sp. NPDC051219]|uniref:hypothetical protein n=1 Tax=Streptomyces sp. NPDC051219 TaxID=3155283 RepID=UPI0034441068
MTNRSRFVQLGRRTAMGAVALLILFAGVWASWGDAQHILLAKGREHGTISVTACGAETCTGPYTPTDGSSPRPRVTIEKSVTAKKGQTLQVVVKPGTDEVVRTGPAGALHAWVPLGGAFLLASLVIAGGLRMPRTAWATCLTGTALLTAAFLAL